MSLVVQKLFEDAYERKEYDICKDMVDNYDVDCGFIFSGKLYDSYLEHVYRGLHLCKHISVENVENIYETFWRYAIWGNYSDEAIENLELLGQITKYENYTQKTLGNIIILISSHPCIRFFEGNENLRFKICKNIMRYDFDEQNNFDIFSRCMGNNKNDEMMMMLLFVNGKENELLRNVDTPYFNKNISYMGSYKKYSDFCESLYLIMYLDMDIDVKNIVKRNLFDVTFLKNN